MNYSIDITVDLHQTHTRRSTHTCICTYTYTLQHTNQLIPVQTLTHTLTPTRKHRHRILQLLLYHYIYDSYIINYFIWPVQGYKVYQDQEGTRSLEQSDHPEMTNKNTVTIDADDNSYYKQRILTLNEEIKALNNEVAMVTQLH